MVEEVDSETAHQLFARLSERPKFHEIDGQLFKRPNVSDNINGVELFGKSSSGKTEILLHIIINTILPKVWKDVKINGKESCILLIDLDNKFPFTRLVSLLEKRYFSQRNQSNVEVNNDTVHKEMKLPSTEIDDNGDFVKSCLERFFKITCCTSIRFLVTLRSLYKFFKDNADCILLLIDNINTFYWIDRSTYTDYSSYHKQQQNIIKILKPLLENYNIMLVITRILDIDMNNTNNNTRKTTPWDSLVQQKYHLQKGTSLHNGNAQFSCTLSSSNANAVYFYINENGVQF